MLLPFLWFLAGRSLEERKGVARLSPATFTFVRYGAGTARARRWMVHPRSMRPGWRAWFFCLRLRSFASVAARTPGFCVSKAWRGGGQPSAFAEAGGDVKATLHLRRCCLRVS